MTAMFKLQDMHKNVEPANTFHLLDAELAMEAIKCKDNYSHLPNG